jgi:hypothetical protein
MKLPFRFLIALIATGTLLFTACEKEEGENETRISSYHSDESHHTGENCMNCHSSGGPGEGWFTIAGTVYAEDQSTPYPNATIRLYTGSGESGSLKATVEVDQKGNFYTTENIDFGDGLYAVSEGETSTKNMGTLLTTGKCNQCHGESTGRIWVK